MTAPTRRKALGDAGEAHAAAHLERLGLQVVERQFRTRYGELDLIAVGDEVLVFAEVKTRGAGAHGSPWDSLTPAKQQQVRQTARAYLGVPGRPRRPALRFDAIGVVLDPAGRLVRLDHLEGAF